MRKFCVVAVSLLAVAFILTSCSSNTSHTVTVTSSLSDGSNIAAGSGPVQLSAANASDSQNGGDFFALSGQTINALARGKTRAKAAVAGTSVSCGFLSLTAGGAPLLPTDAVPAGSTVFFNVPDASLATSCKATIVVTSVDFPSQSHTINFNVLAPAKQLSVSAPATAVAGTAFNFTVTALEADGSTTATSYTGTVHFTATDSAAGVTLPADYTFVAADNGVHTFSATLKTPGTQKITATDTVTNSITGTSGNILVSGPATHFMVSAPASATAGTAINVTVTALDSVNNTATGYSGTVHFTSSDGQATLPANATLTNGTGSFNATLKTAGSQTITATDTVTSSITGTSNSITVNAAAASHFAVSAPAAATAGTSFSFTVTAQDPFNNTATAYSGTVHFTSSDGSATLPANSSLTNGTGTFSATLKTAGSQTVTATDTVTSSITGTSNSITVNAAAATHLMVSAPANAAPGAQFSFTVTAEDQFNNTATGYGGTVHFTSSDGSATLPANSTLTNGTKSFQATLQTLGGQTITATDTVTNSITGTSGTITVAANPATHLSVSAASPQTAGAAFSFTVQALDAGNNPTSNYTGTVHFTSSDSFATLPANYTFVAGDNGVHTFTNGATLDTVGSQTLTATDTVTSSITGTSNSIVVGAGAATHFLVSAPATASIGTQFSFTVTAQDQFNNTSTGYSGTVHFTSSDGSATLPANSTLTNGTKSFQATLQTGGNQTLTATDTVTSSITGTSASISVSSQSASIIISPDMKNYGVVGQAYFVGLNVQGGTPPYTFTAANGTTLPPGLSFNANDESLEGTPTTAGSFPFTVKVTDSTNLFNTADVTVTIAAAPNGQHDSWLNGRYSCLVKEWVDNGGTPYPRVSLASIPFTGSSTFSGASFDTADAGGSNMGVLNSGTGTGTVNLGSDNHGVLTFTSTINGTVVGTTTFAIAANNLTSTTANEVHGVELDDIMPNPSGQHGEVSCYLQSSPFAPGGGNSFALEVSGSGGGQASSTVAVLQNFSSNTYAGGENDGIDTSGVKTAQSIPAGTYTTPDSTTHMFEIVIPKNGTPHNDIFILPIDAARGLVLGVKDPLSGSVGDVNSGLVHKQMQSSFSNANLNGKFVGTYVDTAYDNTGNVSDYNAVVLQGAGNGSSGMTVNHLFQDKVQVISGQSQSPTFGDQVASPQAFAFTVGSNGRAAFAPDPSNPNADVFLYFYDNNSAFIMDTTSGIGVGVVEPQSSTATPGSSTGTQYMEYDLPSQAADAGDQIGLFTLTTGSPNTFTGMTDRSEEGSYRWSQPLDAGGGTLDYLNPDSNGLVLVQSSGATVVDCLTISTSKLACISSDDHPTDHVLQK